MVLPEVDLQTVEDSLALTFRLAFEVSDVAVEQNLSIRSGGPAFVVEERAFD